MNALRAASLCIALPLLAACGDAAAGAAFAGSVDTLANGAVHVKNPATGMWKEGQAWRLVEELRIGEVDGSGPATFGRVTALEADPLGRVYVLDGQAKEIRVFGGDGGYVRSLGREGAGPGELRRPAGLHWDPAGRLWTLDRGNLRFAVFDTAGNLAAEHRKEEGGATFGWQGGIARDGSVFADESIMERTPTGGRSRVLFVRYDSLAQPRDTFALPEHSGETFEAVSRQGSSTLRMVFPVPFSPRLAWTLDADGYLWTGVADRYRLARLTPAGDTVRVVERDWTPAPVSAGERARAEEELRPRMNGGGDIDLGRIPTSKPAFRRIVADDRGRIWVLPHAAEADDGRVLDVFDAEGRFLGAVRSPVKLTEREPLVVRNGRIYAVVKDDLDVPAVVVLRIEETAAE